MQELLEDIFDKARTTLEYLDDKPAVISMGIGMVFGGLTLTTKGVFILAIVGAVVYITIKHLSK